MNFETACALCPPGYWFKDKNASWSEYSIQYGRRKDGELYWTAGCTAGGPLTEQIETYPNTNYEIFNGYRGAAVTVEALMNAEAVPTEITVEPPIPEWVRNADEDIYRSLCSRKGLGNAIEECDMYPENLTLKVCQLIIDNGDMETLGRKIVYQYCFDVPGFDREWDQVDTEVRQEVVQDIVNIITQHKPSPVVVEVAKPKTPPNAEESVRRSGDMMAVKIPEQAAAIYTLNSSLSPEEKVIAKQAFLTGVNWHVGSGVAANVKDFSQEQLKVMAVQHPYYFSIMETSHVEEFPHASAFLDDAENWDIDLNLCIRWDIALQDDDEEPNYGNYYARMIFAKQRKGDVFGVIIKRVYDYEVPRLKAFLNEHWKRNIENWAPISTDVTVVEATTYPSGNMRDAVEPILKVISDALGMRSANHIANARTFLIREIEKNSPPLTSTVAIISWFNNTHGHMPVPMELHDVCMESLRHYQQRSELDDPRRNADVHDEREKFIRRVSEKIDMTVEEVSIEFAGEGVEMSDIIKIAHTAALGAAGRVLEIIDGTEDDPVLEDHPGYFLIPKDLGIIHGPDISGHLCDLLFEEINT